MRKIILDVDTGTDDAIAIMCAIQSPRLEVVGICTVNGNRGITYTTENTCRLLEYLGMEEIPVYKGCALPMVSTLPAWRRPEIPYGGKEFKAQEVHGDWLDLPPSKNKKPEAMDAVSWYIKTLSETKEKITLVPVGPLTNLAIALFRYEDLPHYVKRIVILGGSAGAGNVTEFGEFNVVSDPHACEVVLRSGIPVTMVGLDALETLCLSAEEVDCIQKKIPEKFGAALSAWNREQIEMGESRITLPGAAAVAVLHDPTLAVSVPRYVRVETVQSGMKGRTVVDIRRHAKDAPNVDVVSTINKEGFLTWLNSLLLDSER